MSAFFRGITSNHDGNFYRLNSLHSNSTKDRLKNHKNVCQNDGYCYTEMPKEDKKY